MKAEVERCEVESTPVLSFEGGVELTKRTFTADEVEGAIVRVRLTLTEEEARQMTLTPAQMEQYLVDHGAVAARVAFLVPPGQRAERVEGLSKLPSARERMRAYLAGKDEDLVKEVERIMDAEEVA